MFSEEVRMFFFYSNDQLCEAYRTAIKTAAEMANASLSGFQRLQDCQLNATQQVLTAHAEAAKNLDAATSIHELVDIGANLAWLQFDKFMSCWSGMHENFGMNQMEFIRQAQTKSMEAIDEVGRMLDGVPMTPGSEQVVTALRLAVNTTRSSYEAGVRVLEQAEREAAARLEEVANEMGRAAKQAANEMEQMAQDVEGEQRSEGEGGRRDEGGEEVREAA